MDDARPLETTKYLAQYEVEKSPRNLVMMS